MLQLEGVEAGYDDVQVLRGLSLEVTSGEVLCVMGRNGAGKSTMMKAIMGLVPVTAGSVTLDGIRVSGLAAHKVPRQGLAYVPQGRRLFGELTVAENIEIGLMTRKRDARVRDNVLELFPRLRERMGQVSRTLSGGEQQMLAIARALLTNPRLLILDEATEGLAPVVRQEIWAAIARLKQGGQSILVIDKAFSELRAVADRCVILERGKSVWTGTPAGLTRAVETEFLGV